VAVQFNPQL